MDRSSSAADAARAQPRTEGWEKIDRVVKAFENAWQACQGPTIEGYLHGAGPERPALLLELAHIDLERRLRAGEAMPVETYLQAYPELAADPEAVLGLLAAEYALRRQFEAGCSATEYLQRFPQYADALPGKLTGAPLPSTMGQTTAADSSTSASTPPGLPVVNGYDVLSVLGRGGMGVVYQARHQALQRIVALKMILGGDHASAADLERFRTEAESIARLQHPHVVQIYEVGMHNGLPYFSLEFCGGGSLAKMLAGTPLPPDRAAALLEKLALGMQAAHAKGVIHRDLKPANVLLADDGTPKITDFGLAKKLDEAGQTHTGAILGTPSYMAPEQAEGKSKELGPACDVYALGAVLYQCLTGRPPFRAATPLETVVQVVSDEPVPPNRLNASVPRDLETICLKCLEKDPRKRYGACQDLADELRRFLAGEPVQARPVSSWERVARWARRRPAIAALLVVSCLAVLALVAGLTSLFYAGRLQTTLQEARDQRAVAEEQRTRADAQRALARHYLYLAQMNVAERQWQKGHLEQVRELLNRQRPGQSDEEDLRGFEWYYLWRQCRDRDVRTFRGHTAEVVAVAFSSDGGRLATAGSDRMAKVWDAASGRELLSLTGHRDNVNDVAFSSDGSRLATASNDRTA